MSNLNTDRHLPGVLLMDGKFNAVCEVCEEQDQKGILDELERANWAIALMNLGSYDQAAKIFQQLTESTPEVSGNHVNHAICQWHLNDRSSALTSWTRALACKYQSLGGGVEVAAMLYYAGTKVGDSKSEKKALSKLKKLWKPGVMWPVPIAGYLLDEIDSKNLISLANDDIPALQERHLCQGHFWLGFRQQRQGGDAKASFEKSYKVGGASILEAERYLAKWELNHN